MPKRSGRKGFAAGPAHPSYRDGSRAQGGPSEPGAPPEQQLAGRALQQIGELIAEGCLTETEGLAEVSAALCKGEAAAGGASPAPSMVPLLLQAKWVGPLAVCCQPLNG